MLLLLLVAGSALPSNSLPMQEQTRHPPQTPSPRPLVQSHNQSIHLVRLVPNDARVASQTYRHLTQASSEKKATTPIASNKVETFATKLRDDLDKQERVLNAFIGRIKQKHQKMKLKLSRVNDILKGLKAEIANATKYANQYEMEATDQSKQDKIIQDEYDKSWKMFSEERENIEFEKKFLEELIKYIRLRKSNCPTK
jgi:predicted ribosome quality control (RQC) complex YloA/Tae2 family protein